MYLIPFIELFREQAMTETRTLMTRGYSGLSDDDYTLAEAYGSDPHCDCRRVMLNILGRRQGHVATISFGFEREGEMAGPFLLPFNPQSQYSGILLKLVTNVLADPAYVARLEAHYRQLKGAVAKPTPEIKRVLAKYGTDETSALPRRPCLRNKPKRRKW